MPLQTATGFSEAGGARLYYEVSGDGRPFVMVHAGIAYSGMWDPQFAEFARDHRVIRYDMRGYGKSAPVEGAYRRYEDLRGVLDHLRVERAIVMGCSMGGEAALDFVLEYPKRAAALIMVGSAPGGFAFPEWTPPPQEEERTKAWKAGDLARAAELDAQMFVDGEGRTPREVDPAVRQKVIEMDLIALKYEKMGLGKEENLRPPAAKRLGEVKLPVLTIVGDRDEPYVQRGADFMVANVPTARKVVMKDTAHLPNMEKPEEFSRHVRAFLAQV